MIDPHPPVIDLSLAASGRGVAAITEDQFIQKPPGLSIEIAVINTEKIVEADLEKTVWAMRCRLVLAKQFPMEGRYGCEDGPRL